jgi:putative membrane protein
MLNNKKISHALGVAAVAALFGVSFAHAQSGSADNSSTGSSAGASSASSSQSSSISKDDKDFMEDIAHANLAEIATGKMALEKSQNEQVKQFAQKMIDDHTKAEDELKQLADAKGVKLPTDTDMVHKTKAATLKPLSGNTFDKQYVKHAGVGDHENTHKLLQKVQSKAKDPDLKAYADKTIKAVEEHLSMAQQLEQQIVKK